MKQNIKVAKELVKLAKSLVSSIKKIKFEDFVELRRDIDSNDGVWQDHEICYCGPNILSKEGKRKFRSILNKNIIINDIYNIAYPDENEFSEKDAKLFWTFLKSAYFETNPQWFEEDSENKLNAKTTIEEYLNKEMEEDWKEQIRNNYKHVPSCVGYGLFDFICDKYNLDGRDGYYETIENLKEICPTKESFKNLLLKEVPNMIEERVTLNYYNDIGYSFTQDDISKIKAKKIRMSSDFISKNIDDICKVIQVTY